jgi:hypothetical protein
LIGGRAAVNWGDKKSVGGSYWFKGYCDAIRGEIKTLSQMPQVKTLRLICIKGGPITQLEQETILTVVADTKKDLQGKEIDADIEVVSLNFSPVDGTPQKKDAYKVGAVVRAKWGQDKDGKDVFQMANVTGVAVDGYCLELAHRSDSDVQKLPSVPVSDIEGEVQQCMPGTRYVVEDCPKGGFDYHDQFKWKEIPVHESFEEMYLQPWPCQELALGVSRFLRSACTRDTALAIESKANTSADETKSSASAALPVHTSSNPMMEAEGWDEDPKHNVV